MQKQLNMAAALSALSACAACVLAALAMPASANTSAPAAVMPSQTAAACLNAGDDAAQLACFKAWAKTVAAPSEPAPASVSTPSVATPAPVVIQAEASLAAPDVPTDCKSSNSHNASALQRFWELTPQTDCDTFGLRGYKPLSLMWSTATDVNKQPSSPQVGHTASSAQPYQNYENLIQLSVRTKVAKGLLVSDGMSKDALWFGYTQKSFWQLFNGELSRPFRATDHQPELMYIYPTNYDLGHGWNWRYAGLSVNHQSNGQTQPLSRSWNRAILMAGIDHPNGSRIEAKLWRRLRENPAHDDNPDVTQFMGKGEINALWALSPKTSLGITARHGLTAGAKGSVQLDWFKQPSNQAAQLGAASGLRYHVQLFSGYGDSLTDYNHKRTALRVGLSLVDW